MKGWVSRFSRWIPGVGNKTDTRDWDRLTDEEQSALDVLRQEMHERNAAAINYARRDGYVTPDSAEELRRRYVGRTNA